ncbi:MAG: hypothetical protein RMJ33_11225 [Saprospiraceae bacterium]|nr:hypothetical protein [Saprospiraceae bacterium]MDW8230399.1 hypothetical protein [Saprospiraceae bacterium]
MKRHVKSLLKELRTVALFTYDKIAENGRRQGLQEGIQLGVQQEREASKERFALCIAPD